MFRYCISMRFYKEIKIYNLKMLENHSEIQIFNIQEKHFLLVSHPLIENKISEIYRLFKHLKNNGTNL